MAIVKMKKLRLMIASPQRDALLHELMLLGCVQVCKSQEAEEYEQFKLQPAEVSDLVKLRSMQNTFAAGLNVLKRYEVEKAGLKGMLAPLPEVDSKTLLDETGMDEDLNMAQLAISLDEQIRKNSMQRTAKNVEIQGLKPWLALDYPMEENGTKQAAVLKGTIPVNVDFEDVKAAIAEETELAEVFLVSSDKSFSYVAVVAHRSQQEAVQGALRKKGFASLGAVEYCGTAAEITKRDEDEIKRLDLEDKKTIEKLQEISTEQQFLKIRYDSVTTMIAKAEAESKLMCTESTSVFEGWMPAESKEQVESVLEKYDCAWELADPEESEYPEVPVKLKNGRIARSLNAVTEMYSLPAYDGVDPNPYMAPFFIFFYGMMMADMGYGLLMILVCLLVLKKKKPSRGMRNFFELFLWCGFSTLGWGAVTGGFFGDAPYQVAQILNPNTTFQGLPSLINPLEDTVAILIGAVAMGFVHIVTGMAIGFAENIKRGDWKTAVNDQIAWWVVFIGIACLVLGMGPWVLAAGGVLVVAGSCLTNEGLGKITGIFGSLYSNVTGYFGDLLSYARLMALMLAGSVIAQVFNTLGAIPGNIIIFLIISMAGNALNLGLNLLGCFVHDLRLQCLEFFGKFYKDGGIPFRPLNIQTRYFNVSDCKEEL